MGIVTERGVALTDEMLEAEAEALERGEWPEGWETRGSRQVSVTLPGWVVDSADRESRRLNVPRRSVLNMWLASGAERAIRNERDLALAGA